MSDDLRSQLLPAARKVVIKLGTQLLTAQAGGIDEAFLRGLAGQIILLRERGMDVTVVSSGAIGAGCALLGLSKRPRDVAELQAVAAVGQRQLMTHYHQVFEPLGVKVAQLLLTRGDFEDRVRFLNIRNCLGQLQAMGCLPILNENDTVAVEELRFGDNDQLAAMTCHAIDADVLILLTVVDGLLDESGQVIEQVDHAQDARRHATDAKSALGSGGMFSKLESARLVTLSGQVAVIANGRTPEVLSRILSGEKVGTLLVPGGKKIEARKRWIGLIKRTKGTLVIDEGAVRALCERGKSLLATGIVSVEGRFERGDAVLVQAHDGRELARGMSNYSDEEVRLIMGKKSSEYEKLLGRVAYAEVIHRDQMVMTGE